MELVPSDIKIFHTLDHETFKTQEGNRDLASSDLKKIEKKILDNNLLRYHPILVSKEYHVIDGQHRLEVAKRNNLDVYFIVMEAESTLETTQLINTTGKPWQVKDFLKSYIALGNEEYIKFNKYLQKYKFLTTSQLIGIAVVGGLNKAGATDLFRSGKIKLRDSDFIEKILNDIQYYDGTSVRLSKNTHFQRFITATNKKGIEFNHKRMIAKIELNIDIVKRIPNNPRMYAEVLGDIYNNKLSMGNKINFNIRAIK